jgi:hypothetical protein
MHPLKNITTALLLLVSMSAWAQRDVDDNAKWNDRLYFGGGGGFSGGSNSYGKYFYFSVNPVVGYMITSNASVGTGFIYQRTSYSDLGLNYTQYGVNPFVRYNFSQLFLTAEYNYINIPVNPFTSNGAERVFKSRMLFGAGYSVPMGSSRGRINAMALYDVLYKQPSVFSSPWVFRVFFSF